MRLLLLPSWRERERNQYFDQFDSDKDDGRDDASLAQEEDKVADRVDCHDPQGVVGQHFESSAGRPAEILPINA
jgi:hypothetical protein